MSSLVEFILLFYPLSESILAALWRTYPPTSNYGHLPALHKAPILDLQWSLFSPLLYTVSADHTLIYTDLTTGQRARKLRAHHGIINSLDRTLTGGAGVELVATASDDGCVHVWEGGDEGSKAPVATFEVGCPVTSVAWSADGSTVYAGALDNEIHVRYFLSRFSSLLIFFPLLRSTISANKPKYMPSQDTPRRPPPSPSPPTATSSSRPLSPPTSSSTTCVPSRLARRVYTVCSQAHRPGLRTRCSGRRGARTTEVGALRSVGRIGWCVSGRWRVERFCIRCVLSVFTVNRADELRKASWA